MKKEAKKGYKSRRMSSGIWVMIVAGVLLEAISCTQYFTSRAAIRHEAELRAKTELRKAELEIELHTIELETAAKALAMIAEKHVGNQDSIFSATRLAVSTLRANTSMAVAYIPNYFPNCTFFEACSSKFSEDSIYTRQIGSAEHDYTQMEWFQNGFVQDSCWWSEPYLDDSGSQTYVVSCSYPVHDHNGKIVAVVCVDLSLSSLKNISDYLQVYPNSYYTIRSGTGVAIVPAPDTIPGRKYNIFQEEIDATGWHIEVIIPEEVLFADLNRIGILVGILMLVGLIVLALILLYSAHTTQRMLAFAEKNQRIEGELEIAQTIQRAMLPKVFPPFSDRLDLNIFGMVRPAKEIGGDLYDFYVRHEKLFFCVGDVSGKGVPASLVMATVRSLFRSITEHEEQSHCIVQQLNDALAAENEQNMFVTLFLGVLDLQSGALDYCNAGHNAPVHVPFGQAPRALEVDANLPIGILPGYTFTRQSARMRVGDTLFLYTDGLTEAENMQHALFGDERMVAALSASHELLPVQLVDAMEHEVASFVGEAEQSDDLTMLAIRFQTPALIMRNDIQQIPTLAEWIEDLHIPAALEMPVNLALEEAVTNVMLYAYPGRNDGRVYVECIKEESEDAQVKRLVFTISDSGIPFDPTQAPEADTTLSLEDRAIGGLGIHLVRQLMDDVRYQRIDDKNILTLVKNL